MHPVFEKARAMLANREQDEAEHQRWREQRADQIFAAETDALVARVEATKAKAEIKQRDYGDVIYKVNENALVRDDVTDQHHHHYQSQPTTQMRRTDLGAEGIYYRAIVGPFASMEEAAGVCSTLKAAGGNCRVERD
jgi:hypothetical protein